MEIFSKESRLALIRFCLCYGTHLKCSTTHLLRPLDFNDLENAFIERENEISQRINKYYLAIEDYKKGKELPKGLHDFFQNSKPPLEKIVNYYNSLINQEKSFDLRKEYRVVVSYGFITKNELEFHQKMNPCITFGYSNVLHEECKCGINEEILNKLLPAFKNKKDFNDLFTYGAFSLYSDSNIRYDDLAIWKDDRLILNTITHERIFNTYFTEDDMEAFKEFEDKKERNKKILTKITAFKN